MTVGIVGDGPAVEIVEATLADVDVPIVSGGIDIVADVDLAVVVGLAGSDGFHRANQLALDAGTTWIAVEVGGVGGLGIADVDATVSVIDPDWACFECLYSRVRSVAGESDAEPRADRSAVRVAGAYAGQLAVESISGADVAGTVVEVPHARRELLPVPHCQCETTEGGGVDRTTVTRTLDETASRAERAIDGRIGLVTDIGEHSTFPAPYYLATLAETTGFSDAAAPDRAAGVDEDWNRAFMKAVGEGLERYSAAIYRESSFRTDTIESVDGVSPERFGRPDDTPDPDPSDEVAWVEGVDLSTDEGTWLPADFVHFPPPTERYASAITTGLGLGNDAIEAMRSGLYEVVERDATMLAWYSTYEPLELAVTDDRFDALARRARSEDLTVTPMLVTQDVDVPVVSVAVRRDEWPAFAVGSAADLEGEAAASAALAEALQNWIELRDMGRERAAEAEGAIGRYGTYPREVRSFTETSGRVDAATVGPDEPLSGADELDALIERVGEAGLSPYVAAITPRDVEAIGFEAVRVLVPGAQPLFVSEPFFGERATRVPRELGYEPRLDRPFHPYP